MTLQTDLTRFFNSGIRIPSGDERKKPNTICFCDKTKRGVDAVDMVIGKYTTKYKIRRWTMNAFAYMLDTTRTNAHTVFKEIKHDIRTFDFIWQLGMLLVKCTYYLSFG